MNEEERFLREEIKNFVKYPGGSLGNGIFKELKRYIDADKKGKETIKALASINHHKWETIYDVLMEAEKERDDVE